MPLPFRINLDDANKKKLFLFSFDKSLAEVSMPQSASAVSAYISRCVAGKSILRQIIELLRSGGGRVVWRQWRRRRGGREIFGFYKCLKHYKSGLKRT